MNVFFFDANKYASVFSKKAILKPAVADNWLATWRDIDGHVRHDLMYTEVTNNQAEYRSMLFVLKHLLAEVEELKARDIPEVTVVGDSQIVIYQMTGKYTVKEPDLKQYWLEAVNLVHVLKSMHNVTVLFEWVKRELNNKALGLQGKIKTPVPGLEE